MIIIEGIDGVGKTTIAEELEKIGYTRYHLTYEEKSEDGYLNILKKDIDRLVLDRSFVSELVYGPILRNYSRINKTQTENIIRQYQRAHTKMIYLKATKATLLRRRENDIEDLSMLQEYYDKLNASYDKIMQILGRYFSIIEIDTSEISTAEVVKIIKDFIKSQINMEEIDERKI